MEFTLQGIIIQLVLFLFIMGVLRVLVFEPMLKLKALQVEKTEKREVEAMALSEKADEISDRCNKAMREIHQQAEQDLQKRRAEAEAIEKDLVSKARGEGQKIVSDMVAKLEGERSQVQHALEGQTKKIADDLVQKVLA